MTEISYSAILKDGWKLISMCNRKFIFNKSDASLTYYSDSDRIVLNINDSIKFDGVIQSIEELNSIIR